MNNSSLFDVEDTNQINLLEVASCSELQDYISENLFDPWKGTPLSGYRYMDNKQKGELGERMVSLIMEKFGYEVDSPVTTGHDRIIDNILTEIKFSLAHTNNKNKTVKPNVFTLNHVSVGKDWERLIFCGVNPEPYESVMFWMTKEQFVNCKNIYFNSQQGGKDVGNDDFMCSGSKIIQLSQSEFVNSLDAW